MAFTNYTKTFTLQEHVLRHLINHLTGAQVQSRALTQPPALPNLLSGKLAAALTLMEANTLMEFHVKQTEHL